MMPKGKETEAEEPMEQTPEVPEEPQVEAPTRDYDAELQALRDELTKKDESYKGIQRTLNQKDQELRKYQDVNSRLDQFEETQKIFAAMLNERLAAGEIDESQKKDYLQEFNTIQEKQKQQREETENKAKMEDYNRRADDVYARAEKAMDDDGVDLIYSLLRNGDIERADKRVSKAEAKGVKEEEVPKEKPKSTKDMSVEELEEMVARKKGLLQQENIVPSGKTMSYDEAAEKFASGEITRERYEEIRRSEGINF